MLRELLLPLLGTTLGAACVFFVRKSLPRGVQRSFTGFAAGVMVAASVWSLLIPSMEYASGMENFSFLPAAVGFAVGMLFLMMLDRLIPHLHMNTDEPEGRKSNLKKSSMMALAVALHNLPEGMAVGVVLAGMIGEGGAVSAHAALALSLGIAIQNFPEGAIISVPLKQEGVKKGKAFFLGFLSGAVEPIAALITLLIAGAVASALPYVLGFAAGAMLYVVVEELIPEMSEGEHSHIGTVAFSVGFLVMMALDVMLG
ncbi:MAG: ZIP family metal transporter [Clostridia bacterium]|nr:ZIP family metal transporter [Clostridia bacterium]